MGQEYRRLKTCLYFYDETLFFKKGWNFLELSLLKFTEKQEVTWSLLALFITFVSDINIFYLKTEVLK